MSVHTTVRSFQCHICGQMFKTRQVQQRHLQGVHLKTNWHECTRCKRSFSSKYTLKRHLRQHDEDGNINLQNQMDSKRILNQMTGSVEVTGVGQQQDFVEGQVQDQMDENATAIQTITITSDNLGEFAQHLQPVTGQLQAAGDIGEVYIQGRSPQHLQGFRKSIHKLWVIFFHNLLLKPNREIPKYSIS